VAHWHVEQGATFARVEVRYDRRLERALLRPARLRDLRRLVLGVDTSTSVGLTVSHVTRKATRLLRLVVFRPGGCRAVPAVEAPEFGWCG
jgi:hypothetical protein